MLRLLASWVAVRLIVLAALGIFVSSCCVLMVQAELYVLVLPLVRTQIIGLIHFLITSISKIGQ